jgi:uncharacterized membrane protein YbaN (DUF454 family)
MLHQRWIGPVLQEWYHHRSMPRRTKLAVIVMTTASFGLSIALFARPAWLKLLLAGLALVVIVAIARIPSRR